jgi:formate dehydrogenase
MVFLTRSLGRMASRSAAASFSTARATPPSARVLSRGAQALKYNQLGGIRTLTGKREKVKVLLVLYDGKSHAIDVSNFTSEFEGCWLIQLQVPELLGTTENELGIRKWLEDQGHTLVTTSDKEGENSKFDQELVDSEIIITTPYVELGRTYCKILTFPDSTQVTLPPSVSQRPRS